MSILVALHHVTHYTYDRLINLGPQVIRLRPAPHCRTKIPSYSLKVTPAEHFMNWQQDPHGNWLARFVFPEKTRRLHSRVDLDRRNGASSIPSTSSSSPMRRPILSPTARTRGRACRLSRSRAAGPPLGISRRPAAASDERTIGFSRRSQRQLQHDDQLSDPHGAGRADAGRDADAANPAPAATPPGCWSQMLRHLGLAARFVSGYLIQLQARREAARRPRPAPSTTSPICMPGPRSIFPAPAGSASIRRPACSAAKAISRSARRRITAPPRRSPAPSDPAEVEFDFEMKVDAHREAPRVTQPFSDEHWERLDALGEKVDARSRAPATSASPWAASRPSSRSTISSRPNGTPTPSARPSAARRRAIRRLRERFAPRRSAALRPGQMVSGRDPAALGLCALLARDGKPIWHDPKLIAVEAQEVPTQVEGAEIFAKDFAERLGIKAGLCDPGLRGSGALDHQRSANCRSMSIRSNSKIEDPEARARMVRVFERGLSKPSGFVLPVQRWNALPERRWASEKWPLRRGRLFLMPGDSPIGFRLPLSSLPYIPQSSYPFIIPQDPLEPRGRSARSAATRSSSIASKPTTRRTAARRATAWRRRSVRTAITVEPRDGVLCVFMPPVETLEDYLELLAAVEATAAGDRRAGPYRRLCAAADPRLDVIKVTPDPGVIEVNIQPGDELAEGRRHHRRHLTRKRGQSRLGTDKFMLDGRHTGTGGGNHIVLGGATPGRLARSCAGPIC